MTPGARRTPRTPPSSRRRVPSRRSPLGYASHSASTPARRRPVRSLPRDREHLDERLARGAVERRGDHRTLCVTHGCRRDREARRAGHRHFILGCRHGHRRRYGRHVRVAARQLHGVRSRRHAQQAYPALNRLSSDRRRWDRHPFRAAARRSAPGHHRGYGSRDRSGTSRAHIRSLLATEESGRRGHGARPLHRSENRGGAWRTGVGPGFSPGGDPRLHVAARTARRLKPYSYLGSYRIATAAPEYQLSGKSRRRTPHMS